MLTWWIYCLYFGPEQNARTEVADIGSCSKYTSSVDEHRFSLLNKRSSTHLDLFNGRCCCVLRISGKHDSPLALCVASYM